MPAKKKAAPAATPTNLADRAMLVRLTVSSWSGQRQDRAVSAEIAEAKKAQRTAGLYLKNLLPRDALADVTTLRSEIRDRHYALTMPWDDGSYRLLPIELYNRYREEIDALQDRRLVAVRALLDGYKEHIKEAKVMLGDMFSPGDYPTPEALAAKIRSEYQFMPVPDAAHFVADLPKAEAARIRRDVKDQIEGRLKGTVVHLYGVLAEIAGDVSERLGETEDGKPRVFRDSLLTRLRSAIEIVPKSNLTGDAEIEKICKRLAAAVEGVEADHLRVRSKAFDPDAHRQLKAVADDLAERFAGYFGDDKGAG